MVYPDIVEPDKEEEVGTGTDHQKEGSTVLPENSKMFVLYGL